MPCLISPLHKCGDANTNSETHNNPINISGETLRMAGREMDALSAIISARAENDPINRNARPGRFKSPMLPIERESAQCIRGYTFKADGEVGQIARAARHESVRAPLTDELHCRDMVSPGSFRVKRTLELDDPEANASPRGEALTVGSRPRAIGAGNKGIRCPASARSKGHP